MTSVAVIGAGLAGLTAAKMLQPVADVTVYEKSRGVSGRMSTRRASPFSFDHGAQSFTVQTDAFRAFIEPMLAKGIIKPWDARFVEIKNNEIVTNELWSEKRPHYVGVPGMNAINKHLCQDIAVCLETKITKLQSQQNQWLLFDSDNQCVGEYDWVISAVPAPQAAIFLPASLSLYASIQQDILEPCYSLMLGFENAIELDFDVALVHDIAVGWISVNSTKPERDAAFSLVIQSNNQWANECIDSDLESVRDTLIERASKILQYDLGGAVHTALHKWRYANVAMQNGAGYLIDLEQRIGVCGDWLIHGKIEAAFTSGRLLAEQLQRQWQQV